MLGAPKAIDFPTAEQQARPVQSRGARFGALWEDAGLQQMAVVGSGNDHTSLSPDSTLPERMRQPYT